MKRIITAGLALVLFVCMLTASAGSAGTAADPFVSRDYLESNIKSGIITDGKNEISKEFTSVYNKALSALEGIFKTTKALNALSFAGRQTEVRLKAGNTVSLITGTRFTHMGGTAVITFSSGSVINISSGAAAASGETLNVNQSYFCCEDTTALISFSTDGKGFVDGYYATDGLAVVNHKQFKDVRSTDWFYAAVDYVFTHNLFNGTSGITFSPNDTMTRGMFVTVVHRLAGLPAVTVPSPFSDVTDTTKYYYDAISWASSAGIIFDDEAGTFSPDKPILRHEMALYLYRYAAFKGYNMYADSVRYDTFPDNTAVPAGSVDALKWATAKGVINGAEGLLIPVDSATRSQVAQIFINFKTQIEPQG